jgi:hypothetical protein
MSTKAYRIANREKINARVARWRAENPERHLERVREWKAKNREKVWASTLLTKFNITPGEYDWMYEKQLGRCAICFRPETQKHHSTQQPQRLAVDHCHKTNKVRGLLCTKCNKAVGLLGDTEALLRNALEYLRRTT